MWHLFLSIVFALHKNNLLFIDKLIQEKYLRQLNILQFVEINIALVVVFNYFKIDNKF